MIEASPRELPEARPVWKSAGGKTRLLPELTRYAPRWFRRYFEPFAGGAALFFHLMAIDGLVSGAVLNDDNPHLANVYRMVAGVVEAVIAELETLQTWHRHGPAEAFKLAKAELNGSSTGFAGLRPGGRQLEDSLSPATPTPSLTRAAALALYLNRTGFNGLWRVNRAGHYNVPLGRYDHQTLDVVRANALRAAAGVLGRSDVEIRCGGYADGARDAGDGDFAFFDPPYAAVNATANFVGYTRNGFGEDEQRGLEMWARELATSGVHVMLSNADVPLVREIYGRPPWRIHAVTAARAINSKGDARGKVGEVIVTSYETGEAGDGESASRRVPAREPAKP